MYSSDEISDYIRFITEKCVINNQDELDCLLLKDIKKDLTNI